MMIDPSTSQAQDQITVSTREKVSFLSSPTTYGVSKTAVKVMETHMSWVFLTDDRVYKLKKPVKYPFLDFGTLAARKLDCDEEVRLNRRLAPGVYLGVMPLTRGQHSTLVLDGEGEVVDWLVVMRRLPVDLMLDTAIAEKTVSPSQITGVADLISQFYRSLPPADISPEDYVLQFAREQAINRSLLTDDRFALPAAKQDTVLTSIEAVITDTPELLMCRVRDCRIVDGHGDLRPEHVCLSDPPVIIDCLEFNRNFRLVDPFDELSYLGLECEQLGLAWIGETLIDHCAAALHDKPPDRLLAFYTAYRACLRARISLAHLVSPDARRPEKWLPLACAYLDIAEQACIRLFPQGSR